MVSVIPIRMMEAWLLFDEKSIRFAAGSPRGRNRLDLPALFACETLSDPKALLHRCLLAATGKSGRHLRRFNTGTAIHRVAELIPDYSPLRGLTAFERLESNLDGGLRSYCRRSRSKVIPMKPRHISSSVPSPQVTSLSGLFGLRGFESELL